MTEETRREEPDAEPARSPEDGPARYSDAEAVRGQDAELARDHAGTVAVPAAGSDGFPRSFPTPTDEDPYGIRGQTLFDDLYEQASPAPGQWPPSEAATQATGGYPGWPAPRYAVGVEEDPWQAWAMTPEEQTWAPAAHWLALLTSWVGPLVILLTVGERNARVRECAKESLNFELTVALGVFASVLLVFVGVGLLLLAILPVMWLVLRITATVRVSHGVMYRYPVRIRFLR